MGGLSLGRPGVFCTPVARRLFPMSSTSQAVATSARQEAYHGNYYIAGPPQADGSLRWLKRKETNVLYVWPEQKVRHPAALRRETLHP